MEVAVKLMLVAALGAVGGTGTTAADYFHRAAQAADPAQRIELLSRALEVNPNYVPALEHRAALYSILDKKELAFADSARAADLVPGDAGTNRFAGFTAMQLKKYGDAARFYGRSLAADPANASVRAGRIDALLKLHQVEPALADANLLVEHHPGEDFPYGIRADVYEWADRYDDAAADLTLLIGRHPDEPKYYLQRCIDYRSAGQGEKALADAERAIQLKPNTAYALAARGCSYEVLGRLDRAIDDYDRAAELDSDRRYFKIWSCIALRKLGKRAEADAMIREFVKQQKAEAWIAPVLKYLAGQMTEEKVFELAKDPDPQTQRERLCEAYYYIGACHQADGQLDKAADYFKKCLDQKVNNFYEHGFAIRELRAVQKLREKNTPKSGDADGGGEKTDPR